MFLLVLSIILKWAWTYAVLFYLIVGVCMYWQNKERGKGYYWYAVHMGQRWKPERNNR